MSGNKSQKEEPAQTPAITVLESLDVFTEAVQKREVFEFTFGGKQMAIEYERLSPAKQAEIDKIYNWTATDFRMKSTEVFPPRKDEHSYDLDNPDYIRQLQQMAIDARALALYEAVPIFKTGQGEGLKGRREIVEHIQSLGTDAFLTALHAKVILGGLEVIETANFTTGAGLVS